MRCGMPCSGPWTWRACPRPPGRGGRAPNVSSPSLGVPSVTTIRAAAQDLPSPTFSSRQIDVMERILRNVVPEDQIDALLDTVGLDNNQLADYIAQRPPSPPPPPPPPAPRGRGRPRPRGRGRGRGGLPPRGGGGDDDDDGSRPVAGAAAAEGDVVAVAVGVGVAAAPPLDKRA